MTAMLMVVVLVLTFNVPLAAYQKSTKDVKAAASAAAPAAPKVDYNAIDYTAIGRIRQEGLGLRSSKVMEIESGLADLIGPRLTASPNARRAVEWTQMKM